MAAVDYIGRVPCLSRPGYVPREPRGRREGPGDRGGPLGPLAVALRAVPAALHLRRPPKWVKTIMMHYAYVHADA